MRVTADVKQATEKAIRAAARKLFIRKGFESTSTRQIADAAGIAAGTLFNYFPSKEALAVALATDCFAAGRVTAQQRLTAAASLDEGLFTLVAADIRALEPIRSFIADVLDAGLSPFAQTIPEADAIRAARLEDAAAVLARHAPDAATPALMHLYWSLYLGILSFWARDNSPRQEDTWSLLDQAMRMFAASVHAAPPEPRARKSLSRPDHEAGETPADRTARPLKAAETHR